MVVLNGAIDDLNNSDGRNWPFQNISLVTKAVGSAQLNLAGEWIPRNGF